MSALSDEQAGCMAIIDGGRVTWEPVEMPAGPQPVPEWARGLEVDWVMPYWNAPRILIKTDRNIHTWQDMRYTREGERWMAVSPDGVASVHYHSGGLSVTKLRRYRTEDGKLHTYAPQKPGLSNIILPDEDYAARFQPGEWVDVEMLATTQQQGYGGAHITITRDDGADVVLRGPWYGGTPPGFVEFSTVNMADPWNRRSYNADRPWHQRSSSYGLFLREDVFIAIFARYRPDLLLARVDHAIGPRIQPYTHEWGVPKVIHMDRERRRQQAEKFAATPPERRPPSPSCHMYERCGGKPECGRYANKCPTHTTGDHHGNDQ